VVLFGTEAPADGATIHWTTTSPSAARSVSQDSVALATLPLPQP
jgi:hypothetical protein